MATLKLITSSKKKYTLKDSDEIHRGGEGRILAIPSEPSLVAKVYHDGVQAISQEQFNYLSKLDKSLFVVLQDLLLDSKTSLIVGFTMEYLGQDFVPLSTIFSKNYCSQNGFTQAIKNTIAEKLIQAVLYSHQNQIVIGDLNPYNILINNTGEIRFIDVDSYQTPSHLHSGMLLDDIRDYLYGGLISKNSDYFALSVLIFYTFTFAHPFKGIHKTIKKISDRMIKRLPIFVDDVDLIPPKCYEPIQEPTIHNQFERLYINGERFLVSLAGAAIVSKRVRQLPLLDKVVQNDLIITTIVKNTNVLDIYFFNEKGYVETQDNYLIFSTKNKAYVSAESTLSKKEWNAIYLSSTHILLRQKNKLFHYVSPAQIVEITNFQFPKDALTQQFGEILVSIGEDVMNYLYLNEVMNHSIRNNRVEVFSRGFHRYKGLIQNAGGIQRIFYNSGKDIATVKLNQKVEDMYQQGSVGIIQYLENNKVINKYFKIKGLNVEYSNLETDFICDFAFLPSTDGEGFIFEPADNTIKIIRTQDFQQTSEMICDFITQNTKLQYCKAGIIAWEGENVFLLNKK